MSHFLVLVIGPDHEAQLAPFEEQLEVKFNDETEERRTEYDTGTTACVRLVNGKLVSKYDQQFKVYGPMFGSDFVYPEGSELVDGRFNEMYASFEEFNKEWHSDIDPNEDGRFGYWYNPQAKWDWYQVGGRWTGVFKLKDEGDGEVGEPGIMTDRAPAGYVDQCRKDSIDFEGMREERAIKYAEHWDELKAAVGRAEIPPVWSDFYLTFANIDDARKAYSELEAVKLVREAGLERFFDDSFEAIRGTRDEWSERGRRSYLSAYAVLDHGNWIAKGEMGWFGMSNDAVTDEEWIKQLAAKIESLPDDTMITAVDCHI